MLRTIELTGKDLRLITGLAASLGVAVPQAEANLALILEAIAALGPDRDFSSVATYLRESDAPRVSARGT